MLVRSLRSQVTLCFLPLCCDLWKKVAVHGLHLKAEGLHSRRQREREREIEVIDRERERDKEREPGEPSAHPDRAGSILPSGEWGA